MSSELTDGLELLMKFCSDGKGLVPLVLQDIRTKQVLGLAQTDRASFDIALSSRYAEFSMAGSNVLAVTKSGTNRLKLTEARINCEQNSLVYLVDNVGDEADGIIANRFQPSPGADKLPFDYGASGERLVPVITQDYISKDVMILAFANKVAFEHAQKIGYATYWSRSRDQLWVKGDTSGDKLKINNASLLTTPDCVLWQVTMEGKGACHVKDSAGTANKSCYYRRLLLEINCN